MAKAKAEKKSKTVSFLWEGTNNKGSTIKGEMVAASADIVKAELRKQGITPKKGRIKKKSGGLFDRKGFLHYYSISRKIVTIF